MIDRINGFKLEVQERDGLPRVRVSFTDGTLIWDSDKVSISGLRGLAPVFERAAVMAYDEIDRYWARQQEARSARLLEKPEAAHD